MARFTSAAVEDKAKAGMAAFGKGKQKIKGPVKGGPPPQFKRGGPPPPPDPTEPDADDMPFGKGQSKKKVGKGQAKKVKAPY